MNDFLTLGLSPKKAVGRCPHCKEFIDLLVLKCRFCHTVIRRKDALKAIALQERINRKVATENDERALEEANRRLLFAQALLELLTFSTDGGHRDGGNRSDGGNRGDGGGRSGGGGASGSW